MAQNDRKILQYGGDSIPTENGFGQRRQQAFKRYQSQLVKLSVSNVFIQKPTGINNVTAATDGAQHTRYTIQCTCTHQSIRHRQPETTSMFKCSVVCLIK